jgi:hypothetical protein
MASATPIENDCTGAPGPRRRTAQRAARLVSVGHLFTHSLGEYFVAGEVEDTPPLSAKKLRWGWEASLRHVGIFSGDLLGHTYHPRRFTDVGTHLVQQSNALRISYQVFPRRPVAAYCIATRRRVLECSHVRTDSGCGPTGMMHPLPMTDITIGNCPSDGKKPAPAAVLSCPCPSP